MKFRKHERQFIIKETVAEMEIRPGRKIKQNKHFEEKKVIRRTGLLYTVRIAPFFVGPP